MVVGVVVWCSSAGLHKQLGVFDRGGGLDLHVNPVPNVVLQRICCWIHHGLELVVRVELKLVGERAEAPLPHSDALPVCHEAQ